MSVKRPDHLSTLIKLQDSINTSENKFTIAYFKYMSGISPLSGHLFDCYIQKLIINCRTYIECRTNLKNPNMAVMCDSLESSTQEVARQAFLKIDDANFSDFLSFIVAYETLTDTLGEALDGLELGMSDDTFGDFCSLLPLAGPTVVDKILKNKYKSLNAIQKDIKRLRPIWLATLIMEGEAYVEMRLDDAAKIFIGRGKAS